MKTQMDNRAYGDLPPFHPELAREMLVHGLREEIRKTQIHRTVIGVSGGIDSALAVLLAVEALGSENVFGIKMPYKESSPSSLAHADLICHQAKIHCETLDISSMADACISQTGAESSLRRGNIFARMRMIVLYDKSAEYSALVTGTSNKTEMLLGYSTLWGDMAHAVNPLGDLYKSQVRELSRYLGMPPEIMDKAPSADLWEGQSDEEELQLTYDLADRVLYHWLDLHLSREKVLDIFTQDAASPDAIRESIQRIFYRVKGSQFKRNPPVILKASSMTIGREFRNPRDWGF